MSGYVCYICGDPRSHMSEQHHAVPRRYNGSDRSVNVYDVCANCHTALEKMYDEGFYNRLAEKLGLETPARQHVDQDDVEPEEIEKVESIDDVGLHVLACKAVYDISLRSDGGGDGWVPLNEAAEQIREYLPDGTPISTPEELWGNLLEHTSEDYLRYQQEDGVTYLKAGEKGISRIFATGAGRTTGRAPHRMLLRDCYAPLTELGLTVEILEQDGSNMPDARGTVDDISLLRVAEDDDARDVADRVAQFEDEYPLLNRYTCGKDVAIEAESSTGKSKPAATLSNLAHAVNRGERCLFIATTDVAESLWKLLYEEPRYMRSTSQRDVYRLYNRGPLYFGSKRAMRPADASQTVWLYDNRTGEWVLQDSDDREYARFSDPGDIYDEPDEYPALEDEINSAEYTHICNPLVPELEFTGGVPNDDVWDILIPTDGNLLLYDAGELVPADEVLGHEGKESPLADLLTEGLR